MSWIEDIDYMCPWFMNNLRAVVQQVNGLKERQALRMLRQIKKFLVNHPVISVFLAILVSLVFLPIFLFLAFVSSSFVVVSVSALTVLGGTLMMALFSFLVVLSPALVFGGILAVLVYLLLCSVIKVLPIVKRLKYKYFAASRRLRNRRRRRRPAEYEHSLVKTQLLTRIRSGSRNP